MADDRNQAKLLFIGDYINSSEAWWLSATSSVTYAADLEVSSLVVNAAPAGNILLTSVGGTNAPLIFQRPPTDINEPSESLVMNLSPSVPTKPVDGEYITATKMSGTAYDDLAVEGLQIFGNQVIGSPAIAYITGNPTTGDVNMEIRDGSFKVSSLFVSSLFADNVVSTTSGSANSYTASLYMSTPVLYTNSIVATNNIRADNISTNYISTNNGYATALSIRTANISTANISSLVAGSFGASRIDVTLLSSLTGDITFSLVSTLSLFGNTSINPNINLGLGDVIQGLVGGAASQGLGVVLGGAALATGATALVLGRTSGGANPNVFQTVNGTTQLQFSTLGSPTTSVFFDTNSASPGTTPALETSTTITVPAGAYCVRSVSDPLYINNNVSSIQSFGQWVPVIQNNPTLPSFTTSTLTTSTVIAKSAEVSTLAVSTIGGSVRMSSILLTGNLTAQNTGATLTWGSPGFQTVLSQTSTVMGNAWARSLTVAGGPTNITGDTFVQQVFGLSGNFNSITGSNVINGSFLTGSNWVSTPALTTSSMTAKGGVISSLTVSSVNGVEYPPPVPPDLFVSSLSATGTIVGAVVQASGLLTSLNTFNANIINLQGNINTSNALATANFVTVNTSTINALTANAPVANVSTANISSLVGNSVISRGGSISTMNVSTLNGQPYPPPNFGLLLPSTLFLSTVNVNGNFNAVSVSTNSVLSQVVRGNGVSVSTISTNFLSVSGFPGSQNAYMDGIVTSSITVPRLFPGGSIGFQQFDSRGLYAFGAEIAGNVQAVSVSTVNIEADFIKAKGNLIGSNNNTFSWGIGNARSYIVTSTIGLTPTGVAGFPNVNVSDRLTVGQSALFTGGAQFDNAVIGTDGVFSGNLTTSNILSGRFLQATQSLLANQTGYISSLTADIGSITTNTVQNLFVNLVNGQPYPPQSGVTGATPSTMLASTVFVNGGLTNTGIAPITSPIANFSTLSSVRVQGLLTASTVVFNAGMTNTGGLPIITSNLSAVNINNVAFINGQIYPPPSGSTSIPSTLYASTLLVNGGQTIRGPPLTFFDTGLNRTNGNIIANTGTLQIAIPEVESPGGSAFTITAGSTLASTLMFLAPTGRVRFTSSMTVRDPVPVGTTSQAYITTYITGSEAPAGSLITSNVSTFNIVSPYATISTISTSFIYSNIVAANNIGCLQLSSLRGNFSSITTSSIVALNSVTAAQMNTGTMICNTLSNTTFTGSNATISALDVSTINGSPYPLPGLNPVGAITIWAGGSDDGGVQNFNVPAGWLVCNGSELNKLEYANLFGVIGQKYAMNKPLTGLNFYLPDLTFAVPMGTPYRNYASTINTPVQFQVSFETWKSDFVNPASTMMQTWYITQTIGGTLNYGTLFPAAGITQPSWPDVYVSEILSYDGNQGYIVVRSVNNSPIPSTIGGTTTAKANGTVAQDASGTYLYTLGSYNADSAYPQVTRNQTQNEVYPHTHTYSQTTTSANVQNFTGTTIFSVNAATNVQTGLNTSNTISTIGVVNTGTYTAPNFLNMLYIIKY